MFHINATYRTAAVALFSTLAACSSLQPVPYTGATSSPTMRVNQRDGTGRMPYVYKTDVNWNKFTAAIVDPVVVYNGPDNQFDKISEDEKQALAVYMQGQFADRLSKRFRSAVLPSNETLRVKLTLTGAKSNTNVLNTILHFDLVGGPYNAVQAVRDKEGMLSGSVSFAVEIYDSSTNLLLGAYVAKQYPNAWNLPAGVGSMAAAEVGVQKGAEQLVAYLR